MTIANYLEKLRRLLPATRRTRFLHEVEAHLGDATRTHVRSGLDDEAAEARAVAEFGPVDVVAERMRRETVPVAVRRAAGVALVALASLIVPLYAVPENLLPPAPWDARPSYLSLLLTTAFVTWVFAGVHAAFAFVAPRAHGACTLSLAAVLASVSGLAGLVADVAWHFEAPSTSWTITAISAPLTAAAVTGLGVVAAWARSRARIAA